MSTQTIQTTAPCPTWCQEPVGHPFVDEYDIGAERWHRHPIADLLPVELGHGTAQVLAEQMDTLDSASPAMVTIAGGISASLTGGEARSLAAALLRAADVIEASA